jgi:hypothetical protein
MTRMNKKPTRCTIVLKSLKLYCILIPLYMFRPQLWSVTTVAKATVVTDQSWKIQPTQRHTVTEGRKSRIRRLLMMGVRVAETCRAEQEYDKVLMILRLLCFWLVFYSLLSSLMHGAMNLKWLTCDLIVLICFHSLEELGLWDHHPN